MCAVVTGLKQHPPVLFIMGPTASGKTDLAVALVRRFPFAIISVDSAMVYRGLDIGTAKPDAQTLAAAPHRLIDIVDPADSYSAGRFRNDALREIRAIQNSGCIPLLVGGTMLYFRALQHGLARLPDADPQIRARLDQERTRYGLAALHKRLVEIDPASAARIHTNDPQRIQRALEVYQLTGKTLSELHAEAPCEPLPFKIIKIILSPKQRHHLHDRIGKRFHIMLQNGFLSEVENLRARRQLNLDKPALRAVGYRQVWQYLDGDLDYAEMVDKGIAATRQFAKRQLTWLRSETDALWFDSAAPLLLDQVVQRLLAEQAFLK